MKKKLLIKAQSLCAKKEICIWDITKKLKLWDLQNDEQDEIINSLINNNFINQERYAIAFANDKYRFNKWGKNKIRFELLKKNIPEQFIKPAIEQIDEKEYIKIFENLMKNKISHQKKSDRTTAYKKLYNFAINKGFENELVNKIIKKYY